METFICLLMLLKSFIKLWFRLCHFSLQNPKNFRMREPFKFSNERFFDPYEAVNKYSNATLLRQIVSQNLQSATKNLGFSETDLDVHIKMQKSIPSLSIAMYKINLPMSFAENTGCLKKVYKLNET